VEQANALQPDLILLGGDYVCADVESIRDLAPMLGRLNARYSVFAVQATTIACSART
jgi:predicted MPP superfamily phosphohydrolase